MECIVGRCEVFAFVDIIDTDSLQDLALDGVANARLGRDRYCYSGLNLFNHGGIGHAGETTIAAVIGGDLLEGHDGAGACLFGNASLCEDQVSM